MTSFSTASIASFDRSQGNFVQSIGFTHRNRLGIVVRRHILHRIKNQR